MLRCKIARAIFQISGHLTVFRKHLRALSRRVEPCGNIGPDGCRILHCDSSRAKMTWEAKRIAAIAPQPIGKYLEIGLRCGRTFQSVPAKAKIGVDPAPLINLDRIPSDCRIDVIDSDTYFSTVNDIAFDAVYCDGLHEFEQTYRDIINALNCCSHIGFVLVDDAVPSSREAAQPIAQDTVGRLPSETSVDGKWMGDVYKVVYALQLHSASLEFRTIVDGARRPQIVVWRRDDSVIAPKPSAELARFKNLQYDNVFLDGIPPEFQATSLSSVIAQLKTRR